MKAQREWNNKYSVNYLPWEAKKPSTEIKKAIKKYVLPKKSIIDLGCGLGTNSLYLAQKGYHVTAIDIAPLAIQHLKEKAQRKKIKLRAKVMDVVREALPANTYHAALDKGLLHNLKFSRPSSRRYLKNVAGSLKKNGLFILVAGNADNESTLISSKGKYPRLTLTEISELLTPYFEILEIRRCLYDTNTKQCMPFLGWTCIAKKRD